MSSNSVASGEQRIAFPTSGLTATYGRPVLGAAASEREKFPHQFEVRSQTIHMANHEIEGYRIMQRLEPESNIEIIEAARMSENPEVSRILQEAEEIYEKSGAVTKFAQMEVSAVAELFGSNIITGLSSKQALSNFDEFGPNELDASERDGVFKIFLNQLNTLINYMLLAAGVASAIFEEWVEAIAVIIIILVNCIMSTYMEKNAGDALAQLAKMGASNATVIRNGREVEIHTRELVPGDLVVLTVGDTVPSDCRVLESRELSCDESLLTGETKEQRKHSGIEITELSTSNNMAFASTPIVAGNGKAIVTATGMKTKVGIIAKHISAEAKTNTLTPLQIAVNQLGGAIGIFAIIVLVVVVVVGIVTGYEDPSHPDVDPVVSMIMAAIGFAVSAIPEALPMVFTICLSLGCQDMVKRKAQVRKLPAVETLGSCSVICSDKTGTLTEGKMTAINLYTVRTQGVLKTAFYPTKGFDPDGGIFPAEDLTDAKKEQILDVWQAGFNMDASGKKKAYGDFSTVQGIKNLGDATLAHEDGEAQIVRASLYAGLLSSYTTRIETERVGETNTFKFVTKGNMSEGAIVVAAAKAGLNVNGREIDNKSAHNKYPRLNNLEVGFSSSRKMMWTVHKLPAQVKGQFEGINLGGNHVTHVAIVKGAPDRLLAYMGYAAGDLKEEKKKGSTACLEIQRMTGAQVMNQVTNVNRKMAEDALRVLALGIRGLTDAQVHYLNELKDSDDVRRCLCGEDADFNQSFPINDNGVPNGSDESAHTPTANNDDDDEDKPLANPKPITLLGLLGNLDPPREGVAEAVKTCRRAGIRVIMITGDQPTTAAAIAKSISIIKEDADVSIVCRECITLHNPDGSFLDEEVIDEITTVTSVFARAQPEDKIEIVKSLKRKDHIAAMTGDGVNDAAALQAANIGVAMGIQGTDVAKGAAQLVLLDDNFCTIVAAVEEGRKIYSNMQKFLSFLLGTSVGEIVYLTIAVGAGWPLPLQALQVLFINLLCDGFPAVALSFEPADKEQMSVPPRPKAQPILTKDYWFFGILPHVVFQAVCVLMSLVVGLWINVGSLTTSGISDQCFRYGANKKNTPYFCTCESYEYDKWVAQINWYNPQTTQLELLELPGRREEFQSALPSSIKSIADVYTAQGFPTDKWIQAVPTGGAEACTVEGSLKGRTMGFTTAVFCELLRTYTVRTWSWMFPVINRSKALHIATLVAFVLTMVVLFTPGVQDIFDVTYCDWWEYFIAVGFALANLLLDEFIPKPIYRWVLSRRADSANWVMNEQAEDDRKAGLTTAMIEERAHKEAIQRQAAIDAEEAAAKIAAKLAKLNGGVAAAAPTASADDEMFIEKMYDPQTDYYATGR